MAKDSDKLRRGFDEETGGGLSGLLAEEDEFDRRTLWRLGTWAAGSVGAVVLALVVNQSSIGLRREQTASADLMRQAQALQLATRESQSESRRLASAIDTLNSDRDRLYSRVAGLEQGLDSVTGAIARQAPAPPSSSQANTGPTTSNQANASAAPPAGPSVSSSAVTAPPASPQAPVASIAAAATASTASAPTASADPPPAAAKSTPPAPVVAPVAATAPAVPDKTVADKQDKRDKQDKQASAAPPSEPGPAAKPASAQQSASAEPSGSLMAPKSMMSPPDPAAAKLIEPVAPPRPSTPPKTFTAAPLPEIAAVAPKDAVAPKQMPDETEPDPAPALVARRTEFGVDVGGANSVPGLRALWRGLLKSHTNAALTTLRPVIVIKENNNGLGMQLRLVAGPINDAAAAAKICASLTISDRGCATTVFEGQRLSMGADEQPKAETRTSAESRPVSDAKGEADAKPASTSKYSGHHRYISRHAPKEEDPPKPEPSTLSRFFGRS